MAEMEITQLAERLVKVTVTGRLDTPAVDRLEARLAAALVPGGNNGIVDLSGVDFISSMGLRMFVSTARSLKMRNLTLALFGAPDPVNQVFEAASLTQILPICSNEAEALIVVASSPQRGG
jgi:anti-anti-sigma factor